MDDKLKEILEYVIKQENTYAEFLEDATNRCDFSKMLSHSSAADAYFRIRCFIEKMNREV